MHPTGTDRIALARYDVFTDRPYAGNPLAVAIDQPELTADQMQRIAGELNLSETVFLRSRPDGSWAARIFTPAMEVPFAGHPTVGAALALADAGLVEGALSCCTRASGRCRSRSTTAWPH